MQIEEESGVLFHYYSRIVTKPWNKRRRPINIEIYFKSIEINVRMIRIARAWTRVVAWVQHGPK